MLLNKYPPHGALKSKIMLGYFLYFYNYNMHNYFYLYSTTTIYLGETYLFFQVATM